MVRKFSPLFPGKLVAIVPVQLLKPEPKAFTAFQTSDDISNSPITFISPQVSSRKPEFGHICAYRLEGHIHLCFNNYQ
jgi:hypothetical protein